MTDLKKISVSGRAPIHVSLSGKPVPATAGDIRKGVLVQSGYGKYRVSMSNPDTGVAQYLADEQTGQYYEIDMADPAKRPDRLVTEAKSSGRSFGGYQETRIPALTVTKDESRLPADAEMAVKKKKLITERLP